MTEHYVLTVEEFLESHKISRGTFYDLLKRGEGPETITIGRRRLIPIEAAAAWRKRLAKRGQ
jgi:predicted DNA-binding transcriptional regulator AlpA